MKEIARQRRGEMEWVHVCSFWDVPQAGLCRHEGKICFARLIERWHGVRRSWTYSILEMTLQERCLYWLEWRLFEFCLGHREIYGERGVRTRIRSKRPRWTRTLLVPLWYDVLLPLFKRAGFAP